MSRIAAVLGGSASVGMSTVGTQDGGISSPWGADQLIPFGKYLLLNRISVGATAAVYRAKIQGEAGFERLVAIKRILPHMAGDPAFIETFVREAKIAARLSHTNICPIYELGKVGESIYMAMECIAGKDLGKVNRALADQGTTMPPVMSAWITSKLCEALDYAHTLKDARGRATGIIHRDLSPTNIVVSYEGQVKLIDFGVAKATGRAQQTNVDALKKKLGYMSPEMVRGKTVDHRSDVFGCGITLFEMLTGKRLFSGKDDMATLSMVGKATAPLPSTVNPDVPEELEQIVMKALAREPEDRYQSCADMNDALVQYLAHAAPTYGTRQLGQWMESAFTREMEQERRLIGELLEASHRPGLIDERRRYFASPMGAAAAARAQMAEKLSPRGSMRPPGQPTLLGPPALPSRRSSTPSPAAPPAAARSQSFDAWKPDEIDSLVDDGFDRISMPPAVRPSGPAANPGDDLGFDEEATGFYDPPAAAGGAAMPMPTPAAARPSPAVAPTPSPLLAAMPEPTEEATNFYSMSGGFDEDATQIFFNKDEDIGVAELMEEDIAQQSLSLKPLAIHRPGEVRPLPPSRPTAPPPRSMPPSAQQAPTVSRVPTPQPFRSALPADPRTSLPPADAQPRRAHTMRMQAVQAPPQRQNLVMWIGAALLAAAVALGAVVWLRRPGVGSIEVRTTPARAKVVLDGIHRGEAPLRLAGVHAGIRRVEVLADGYESVQREVELRKGATAMLDIVLTKKATNTVPTITTPPPAPTPPVQQPPAPHTPTAATPTEAGNPPPIAPRKTTTRAPTKPAKVNTWQRPASGGGATWGPPP